MKNEKMKSMEPERVPLMSTKRVAVSLSLPIATIAKLQGVAECRSVTVSRLTAKVLSDHLDEYYADTELGE